MEAFGAGAHERRSARPLQHGACSGHSWAGRAGGKCAGGSFRETAFFAQPSFDDASSGRGSQDKDFLWRATAGEGHSFAFQCAVSGINQTLKMSSSNPGPPSKITVSAVSFIRQRA